MLQATTKGGSQSVTGVTTATVIVAGMSAAATTDASGATRLTTDRIKGAMTTMTEIIAGEDLKVS
jgi:hypothetical protein